MSKPTPDDEAEIESTKAPLLEHLVELRKRIVYSLLAFLVAFLICFAFAKPIYGFLTEPLAHALAGQPNRHLIFTQLYETFFTYVKVGMFAGLCLAAHILPRHRPASGKSHCHAPEAQRGRRLGPVVSQFL